MNSHYKRGGAAIHIRWMTLGRDYATAYLRENRRDPITKKVVTNATYLGWEPHKAAMRLKKVLRDRGISEEEQQRLMQELYSKAPKIDQSKTRLVRALGVLADRFPMYAPKIEKLRREIMFGRDDQ